MEEYKSLEEKLKNFPQYSLEIDKRNKILYLLKSKRTTQKYWTSLKPIMSFLSLAIILLFLFLTSSLFNNYNVQHGAIFTLPDRNQQVIGVEGKIGILVSKEQFIAEDRRRGAKLMLYFWGDVEKLVGKNYRVEAEGMNGKNIELTKGILSSGLNSEDAHALTSFIPFPTEGGWQLSFYVEDRLYESFTINVLPPFPKTKHYTLLNSPKEIPVGKESELNIESTIGDKEKIEVKLIDEKGNVKETSMFQLDSSAIDANTNQTIYHYSGEITWGEHGSWRLLIDGEETGLFEN
ncbi:hypothetical protein [Psychrobacillus sp. FJAT-21963]|uniref:hypothetical protein n=1 Tax=Psychrobacillus sp. FJAT-21963 TaxID=1712028 RepID=UPI0006F243BD|nr:hypothetical protein [Psychrobacillus sp. FJAT-21963]KQL33201.1 hypothetical protein AN959_16640 [Psychrobacillus sp. FJAT-21963]